MIFAGRQNEILNGICNGDSSQGGSSSYDVCFGCFATPTKKVLYEFVAKLFSSSGFWGLSAEEWLLQGFFKYCVKNVSRGGNVTLVVIRLVKKNLHELINHHVAGASIESDYVFRPGIGRNGGEVGDSAEVLDDPSCTPIAEQHIVKEGNQWRSLASGCHVRGTKI